MRKITTIDEWKIVSIGLSGHYRIIGKVYDDIRVGDGTLTFTSGINQIDFVKKEARTMNTTYKLGKHIKK